jgi:hypothetical protein
MKRSEFVENALKVKLPPDYREFIDTIGLISDERGEIFGYNENIKDINRIPCVIGATLLYREDYPNISEKEIVISFDDYENTPIVLDTTTGKIYRISHTQKKLLSKNFKEYLKSFLSKK